MIALLLLAPQVGAREQVAELRAEYDELGRELATSAPDWRPKSPAIGFLLFIAPDEYSPSAKGGDRFRDARNKYADSLFRLATKAADAGQCSLAFEWATETLRENPDHADARRVLGYEQRGGKWLTPYGAKMLDVGKTWNSQRGWVAADDANSHDAGDPTSSGRHSDMKNGWQVRTDHFLVTTNHSLAAGAELAARLERLYQIWRQLFAGFYYSEKEVRDLFAGDRIARKQIRPFRVFYHRDRDDYVSALVRRQPRIGETLGIYFDDTREAHFFASAEDSSPVATLYHEAVHQLFQESKPTARRIAEFANFWVLEGVATYFETLTEHDDPHMGPYFTIGEATAGRLPAARERLSDNYYVPLAELTKLGKDDVQKRADVAKLYSQSSGLAAFLLQGEQGRYREPLVRYLEAVYAGRDNEQTLAKVTGESYSDLDAGYRKFMESLP